MVVAIIVVGGLAEAVAWWAVSRRRVSVWVGLGPVLAAAGIAAVATGRVAWCPAVSGAAAVVGGAAWGGLAFWTRGVLAPLLCHAVWTSCMIALPPDAGDTSPQDAA